MSKIPRRFHFVFGLKPQTEPFHLAHYLCLESCRRVNRPERIDFHCHHEPHGEWWERARGLVHLRHIELESWVRDHPSYFEHDEGQFIKGWNLDYAHQSDFVRLRVLLEEGGVYADIDTLFVQPLPDSLFESDFVIGEEDVVWEPGGGKPESSLCNAFLMSTPGAEFGRRWLERMARVFDGTWTRHSCEEAAWLRAEMPDSVRVVPKAHHYKHPCTPQGIRTLFEELDEDLEDVLSLHLWAHVWWSPLRTDFSGFHHRLLTEEYVREARTTYASAARRFLEDEE